jgi:hypothetical protein
VAITREHGETPNVTVHEGETVFISYTLTYPDISGGDTHELILQNQQWENPIQKNYQQNRTCSEHPLDFLDFREVSRCSEQGMLTIWYVLMVRGNTQLAAENYVIVCKLETNGNRSDRRDCGENTTARIQITNGNAGNLCMWVIWVLLACVVS